MTTPMPVRWRQDWAYNPAPAPRLQFFHAVDRKPVRACGGHGKQSSCLRRQAVRHPRALLFRYCAVFGLKTYIFLLTGRDSVSSFILRDRQDRKSVEERESVDQV